MKRAVTTQYLDVYDRIQTGEIVGLEADDFETVLPLADVAYANLFSLDLGQDIFQI